MDSSIPAAISGRTYRTLFIALAMLSCALPGFSQSLAGFAARPAVLSATPPAAVQGASVTVSNTSLGIERKLTTNDEGYFIAPSLPAAGYEVTVKREGSAPYAVKQIQLIVGQNLHPGEPQRPR